MRFVIYFFGSGLAWYVGLSFLLLAATIPPARRSALADRLLTILAGLGGVVLVLSGTPQPIWLIGGALGLLMVVAIARRRATLAAREPWLRRLAVGLCLLLVGVEMPWTWSATWPAVASPVPQAIHVLGDSVSAGMGENEAVVWPVQLGERLQADGRSLPVISHAQMGATVRSAQQQATHLPESPCLVILAIGGNDLLGPTTDAEFAERLETLLKQISRPNRTLLMLELPLPPLRNEYGRIQRSLAQRYRVVLVPKRVMASVLTGPEATFDSIHLTTQGHAAMAAAMRRYVERVVKRVEG